MQVYRCASGTDCNISRADESSFLEDLNLVFENVVEAFFLRIEECTNTPTQAKLVDQRSLFRKNIQWRFRSITAQYKTRISGLRHADQRIRTHISRQLAGVIANCIAEERRRMGLRNK